MANKKSPEMLTPQEIDAIFASARKHGIGEFKFGGLGFKLSEAFQMAYQVTPDDPQKRQAELEQVARQIKLSELNEMILTNPEAFEDVISQSIDDNKSMDEVIVQ